MDTIKQFIAILFVVMCTTTSLANDGSLYSKKELSITQGLTHNGVTSILSDSKGYLWIGTYEGLNRYDGYKCIRYRNTSYNELFTSNRIRTIYESTNGTIWLGTDNGISIYDIDTETFRSVYSFSITDNLKLGPIVKRFIPTVDHHLLCITEDAGLLLFSQDYTLLANYQHKDQPVFFDGVALDDSTFVLCSDRGTFQFSLKQGKFTPLFGCKTTSPALFKHPSKNILYIIKPHGLNIINYTNTDGRYTYNKEGNFLKEFKFTSGYCDPAGRLWLGTQSDGVVRVNNTDALITNKALEILRYYDENETMRTSCFEGVDKLGCWVGTFNKGLVLLDFEKNPFNTYRLDINNKNAPSKKNILSITALDSKRLLFASNNDKLSIYNTEEKTFEPLPFHLPQHIKIGSVFADSHKDIWLGSGNYNGIFRKKEGRKKVEHIKSSLFPKLNSEIMYAVEEDQNGNIWLGCTNDLYKCTLDKARNITHIQSLNQHPYFKNNKVELIRCIYADPKYNIIWAGSDRDGLIRLSLDHEDLNHCNATQFLSNRANDKSISSNFVTSILRTPNDELWIGTEEGGICRIDSCRGQASFTRFTEVDGLSNNVVKSIVSDGDDQLWISTNIGLNKFSISKKTFQQFKMEDGLPFDIFEYSSCQLDNGLLAFGGLQGLCYFSPQNITPQNHMPALLFDNLQIINKSVKPNHQINGHTILTQSIATQQNIVLKHNENTFSITLNSLHYSNPKNHLIRYRLLPANTEWIESTSDKNYLQFTGLKPGKYTLEAMTSDPQFNWSTPITLHIKIRPPWQKSLLAIICYVLLFVIAIYSGMLIILKIQTLNHKVEIENLNRKNAEENNTAKMRFFSNITHELLTPLTLITAPIQFLSSHYKTDIKAQEQLYLVKRHSRKIQQLIEQVQDFNKSDQHMLKLNPSLFEAQQFFQDIEKDFSFFAKNKHKKLEVKHPPEPIFLKADQDKIEKIFNNLLNNAFKFTEEGDRITLCYEAKDKQLIASLEDTGRGIYAEDLPHIFERFYQSEKLLNNNVGGSGIGLAFAKRLVEMHYGDIRVESVWQQGSTFTIKMPIVTDQVPPNVIENEKAQIDHEENIADIVSCSKDCFISTTNKDKLIYLVEDNDELRRYVGELLSQHFDVRTFPHGKLALAALDEEWPELIVSDILMPQMNGLELCNTIKSDIKTSHIPVLLLSACSSTAQQMEGIRNGADAYITKPFDMEYLLTRIDGLILNREALRERYMDKLPYKHNMGKNKENNIFLEKFYEIINENLDNQDLDLDVIARQLYLNRTHFYQKVKALTGHTPYEFLKNYRLQRAAELLINESYSVSQVSLETGFKSRPHFSKLFKEKYKVSPGQYAASISKNY